MAGRREAMAERGVETDARRHETEAVRAEHA